jgi:hypothetical protein
MVSYYSTRLFAGMLLACLVVVSSFPTSLRADDATPMQFTERLPNAQGVQARARISPNSRVSFAHDAPPSVERKTYPLTLLA